MARTHDDSWDPACGVGATATGAATARALASRGPRPLIDDPFAEPLVRAVGLEPFVSALHDSADTMAGFDIPALGTTGMRELIGVQTRFFDQFFADACQRGIGQIVIVASGLDARGYRTAWPTGTTVFEIDQPAVLEFKSRTLADLGAAPTADLRNVGVDLREDWPAALRAAGLDSSRPTAWSAEGLLPYLPSQAQDSLLDNITALSAPGSCFATQVMPNLSEAAIELQTTTGSAAGGDPHELWYFDDRHDVVNYLNARGWTTNTTSIGDLCAANGIPQLTASADQAALAAVIYIAAQLI